MDAILEEVPTKTRIQVRYNRIVGTVEYSIPDEDGYSQLIEHIKKLQRRVEALEKELGSRRICGAFSIVSDDSAEELITNYLAALKDKDIRNFDDFQIMDEFNIPIEQVDRVLEKLKEKGLLNEQ